MDQTFVSSVIRWIGYGLAAYVLGSVIVLVIGVGIGAIKTKSALWWYLIYSVVVVGMMLAGLRYLPSTVLQFANEGIEASQPEMERFANNVGELFYTAAGGALNAAERMATPTPYIPPVTIPPVLSGPTDGSDSDAGGGVGWDDLSATPTLAPTASATPTPIDYIATADARLLTVTAAAAPYLSATPGPTATYDILKPPTPIIQPTTQP